MPVPVPVLLAVTVVMTLAAVLAVRWSGGRRLSAVAVLVAVSGSDGGDEGGGVLTVRW